MTKVNDELVSKMHDWLRQNKEYIRPDLIIQNMAYQAKLDQWRREHYEDVKIPKELVDDVKEFIEQKEES